MFIHAEACMFMHVHVASKHYANMSVQYTAISHDCKNGNFPMKNVIFIFFSQNIDRGYTLEPPR